jgi:hypothetical protein
LEIIGVFIEERLELEDGSDGHRVREMEFSREDLVIEMFEIRITRDDRATSFRCFLCEGITMRRARESEGEEDEHYLGRTSGRDSQRDPCTTVCPDEYALWPSSSH